MTFDIRSAPVGWETEAEWELETRMFHAANDYDLPEDVRTLIGDLWAQYCFAAGGPEYLEANRKHEEYKNNIQKGLTDD